MLFHGLRQSNFIFFFPAWCVFRNAKSTALEVPIVRRKPAKLCRVRPDRHWPHLYSLSGWLNQKKSYTCKACHSNMAYPCSSGLSYTIFINIPVMMLVMLSCELDVMLFEQCLRWRAQILESSFFQPCASSAMFAVWCHWKTSTAVWCCCCLVLYIQFKTDGCFCL